MWGLASLYGPSSAPLQCQVEVFSKVTAQACVVADVGTSSGAGLLSMMFSVSVNALDISPLCRHGKASDGLLGFAMFSVKSSVYKDVREEG